MKKVYLYGETGINAGPANVNRSLINNADSRLLYPKCNNKYFRLIESVLKIAVSDVLVLSGVGTLPTFFCKVAKVFRKSVIYLMHGCIEYEVVINKIVNAEQNVASEKYLLENCDLILCVSELYAEWVKNRFPQYANKITFLNNGVDFKIRDRKEKKKNSVAVAGGNRNIKNNHLVCEAIQKLNESSEEKYELYVFGRVNVGNENFLDEPNVIYMGQLDEKEYMEQLDQIELFVINSEVESFGLVLADAINCNCSLLLSENTGSRCILKTKEEDVIHDCHDISEIMKKIEYIRKHPNGKRLAESIDIEACSKKRAYKNLMNICEELLKDNTKEM